MKIPNFIRTTKQRTQLSNLMINCRTQQDMYQGLLQMYIDLETYEKPRAEVSVELDIAAGSFEPLKVEYTLLSMYYFQRSRNDPKNSLKSILTRTYDIEGNFTNPLTEVR